MEKSGAVCSESIVMQQLYLPYHSLCLQLDRYFVVSLSLCSQTFLSPFEEFPPLDFSALPLDAIDSNTRCSNE